MEEKTLESPNLESVSDSIFPVSYCTRITLLLMLVTDSDSE